ncbi:MAG: glutamate-cysteine ligase family protein [Alphaproteobacteria bacterium]|nr:glutamate-cysteine ligase family protein [Alphaproteobacteria bacterium]
MSTLNSENDTRLTSYDQLIDYFTIAEKPEESWKIGVEHEKFIVDKNTKKPFSYEGPQSILAIFEKLQAKSWEPIYDGTHIIGLKKDKTIISLEPGGQLELSGAPHSNLEDIRHEINQHLKDLHQILPALNGQILWTGIHPAAKRDDMAQVPKSRYGLMKKYMPMVGSMGLDMMLRTSSIQVNLDFSSEADMVQKFRIATALTPFVVALFANSRVLEGKDTGFESYRTHIWHNTDNDRSGLLPFIFDESMGYKAYIDYALNVPMYFIMRDNQYVDALGVKFIDFWENKAEKLKQYQATMGDWVNHLTTLFPEIRLKSYLEVRMMDAGTPEMISKAAHFWSSVLYDYDIRNDIYDFIMSWPKEQIYKAYQQVPKLGFNTPFLSGTLADLKKTILDRLY